MAKATSDQDEIRRWVEERGGHPARVKETGGGNDPGILRIDFPGFSGEETLEEIDWETFFDWFRRNNLAMLLSEESGNRFNKIIGQKSRPRGGARKASPKKKSTSRRAAGSSRKASASKKAASKKPAAKKTASKKAASKKTSSKKSSAKKASSKKASSKKASSKSAYAKKRPGKKKPRRKWSARPPGGVN